MLDNDRVLVIAEVGINHNADLDIALRLIDAAKNAGADVVKFQKRVPEIAVPRGQWDIPRDTPWGLMSYLEYKRRMEFGKAEYDVIDEYCKRIGIRWTASAWDIPSVEFLEQYDIPFHKVASACLTDDELLRRMWQTARPIVLSTGMSTIEEIHHARSFLLTSFGASFQDDSNGQPIKTTEYRLHPSDVAIMACNSSYPCPTEDLNLRTIQTYQNEFIGNPIGYSGHETGLATTVAAVALGAKVIERHITLDRSMWGTDQAASVEPQGFARLVKDIRNVEKALGDGIKRVTEGERAVMKKLRRVHSGSDILA